MKEDWARFLRKWEGSQEVETGRVSVHDRCGGWPVKACEIRSWSVLFKALRGGLRVWRERKVQSLQNGLFTLMLVKIVYVFFYK